MSSNSKLGKGMTPHFYYSHWKFKIEKNKDINTYLLTYLLT